MSDKYKIDTLYVEYKGKIDTLPISDCLNPTSSIFHSLTILGYDVSPSLELDMDAKGEDRFFRFLENTMPMSEGFEE